MFKHTLKILQHLAAFGTLCIKGLKVLLTQKYKSTNLNQDRKLPCRITQSKNYCFAG